MNERHVVIGVVGGVLLVSTVTLLAVTLSAKTEEEGEKETRNQTTPLLLISLDGFRSDYIFRYVPTLATLAKNGVKARYMMPSYPTITFPNHYTIVTGLYPESHGIVANYFYDPEYNETFSMGVQDGKWWGGEPMWNTLTNQNKTSATFFWPGSDANITGQYPTEWRPFDKSVPFEDRVDQVVEWLSRSENRPDWVSLYFDEPDWTGHDYGPDTSEMDNALVRVDGMIARLLAGLRRNNMEDKVNIIVLADHGMATAGAQKSIVLSQYVPDVYSFTSAITYGAFSMLQLEDPSEGVVSDILDNLTCPNEAPFMRAYTPQHLPIRLHYSNNPRIGDIVLDLDLGYFTRSPNGRIMQGEHGYDNHHSTMSALFIATGPDFQEGVTLEPFQNIEVYNLMCLLTGVEPAPNNGTEGSLYAALLNPPPVPELPEEAPPTTATFPDDISDDSIMISNCINDTSYEEIRGQLNQLNIPEPETLIELHLPWGIPLSGDLPADVILLHHNDHITGYSETLKMPLWTSFTVSKEPPGTNKSISWISDVRLTAKNTPTCDSYEDLIPQGVSMFPLFPPKYSADPDLDLLPYLVSNAVPKYQQVSTLDYVADFLESSKMDELPYNVILGPVFDTNADSLPDDFANFTTPEIPSEFFVVFTRCKRPGVPLGNCTMDLDTASFIIPEYKEVNNNCKEGAAFFLATVHDVELATGLTFFPMLEASARLQVVLKIHRNLWEVNV